MGSASDDDSRPDIDDKVLEKKLSQICKTGRKKISLHSLVDTIAGEMRETEFSTFTTTEAYEWSDQDKSKQAVRDHLSDFVDVGVLDVDKTSEPHQYKFTPQVLIGERSPNQSLSTTLLRPLKEIGRDCKRLTAQGKTTIAYHRERVSNLLAELRQYTREDGRCVPDETLKRRYNIYLNSLFINILLIFILVPQGFVRGLWLYVLAHGMAILLPLAVVNLLHRIFQFVLVMIETRAYTPAFP